MTGLRGSVVWDSLPGREMAAATLERNRKGKSALGTRPALYYSKVNDNNIQSTQLFVAGETERCQSACIWLGKPRLRAGKSCPRPCISPDAFCLLRPGRLAREPWGQMSFSAAGCGLPVQVGLSLQPGVTGSWVRWTAGAWRALPETRRGAHWFPGMLPSARPPASLPQHPQQRAPRRPWASSGPGRALKGRQRET